MNQGKSPGDLPWSSRKPGGSLAWCSRGPWEASRHTLWRTRGGLQKASPGPRGDQGELSGRTQESLVEAFSTSPEEGPLRVWSM